MALTEIQKNVIQHYAEGDFSYCTDTHEVRVQGDGLFEFVVIEAGDASSLEEYSDMLDTAIAQLTYLQRKVCHERT